MRTWAITWLLPIGLVGSLVLLTRGVALLDLLALAWALVLIPAIAFLVLRRSPEGGERLRELEIDYWRFGPR